MGSIKINGINDQRKIPSQIISQSKILYKKLTWASEFGEK